MDIKRSKNILIANPFGIGDVLFSTPLIRGVEKSTSPIPKGLAISIFLDLLISIY